VRIAAGLVVLVVALAGCDRKVEPAGIGPYVFGKMVKRNIKNGVCHPDKLDSGRLITSCFGMPPVKVGKAKRLADIDAYFDGTDDEGALIEIQLQVRGCLEGEAETWVRERFGAPYKTLGNAELWKNSHLWIAGFFPKEPGRCLIRFLPLSEKQQIEQITLEAEMAVQKAGSASDSPGSASGSGSGG
jgi:hypothetical protein